MTTVYGYTYYGRPYDAAQTTVFGEAPGPPRASVSEPLEGARRRIGQLIGLSSAEMAEYVEWRNLLDRWPGYGPSGGSEFPLKAAKHRAREEWVLHRPLGMGNRRFVYLGKRVAAAFDFDEEWLTWRNDQAICPHPSGLNRWWNDPENLEQAATFWREVIEWTNSHSTTT